MVSIKHFCSFCIVGFVCPFRSALCQHIAIYTPRVPFVCFTHRHRPEGCCFAFVRISDNHPVSSVTIERWCNGYAARSTYTGACTCMSPAVGRAGFDSLDSVVSSVLCFSFAFRRLVCSPLFALLCFACFAFVRNPYNPPVINVTTE